jgi:hypothetical protein
VFGDFRVKVVHQHAQWCFGLPAFRRQFRAGWGFDMPGIVESGIHFCYLCWLCLLVIFAG